MASESKALAKITEQYGKLKTKMSGERTMSAGKDTVLTIVAVPVAAGVALLTGEMDGRYTANQADGQTVSHHPYGYAMTALGLAGGIAGVATGSPGIARVGADVAAAAVAGPVYLSSFRRGVAAGLKSARDKAAKAAGGPAPGAPPAGPAPSAPPAQ